MNQIGTAGTFTLGTRTVAAGRRICAIACVQNPYKLANRAAVGLTLSSDSVATLDGIAAGG